MQTLESLYFDQLRDIYNAESELLRALPKMSSAATCSELRRAFQDHLEGTRALVEFMDKVFGDPGRRPAT